MVDIDFKQYNESNHPIFNSNLGGIPGFLCKLNAKFKDRQFCDVRLYPGLENNSKTDGNVDKYSTTDDGNNNKTSSNNSDSVYAHKLILDIASPYFSQVFRLCDKSNSKEGEKLEAIIIPNIDYSTLDFLVRFIYTGDTTFINEENIEKVINGASTFMLQSLKNRCCDIIKSYATVHTCLDKWRLASQKMDGQSSYFTALCTTMTEFVFQNQQVFHLQSFLTLEVKDIFLLVTIATRKTSCSPDSIIEGVIHWVKGNQEDRQEFLSPLLKLINLKEMPVSVLRNVFRENPIVSSDNDCQEYYIEFLEGMALERQNQHLGQNHTNLKIDPNNNNNSNPENTPVVLLQKEEKDEPQITDSKLFQTNPQDHPVILLTEAKKTLNNNNGTTNKTFKVNTSFLTNDLKATPTAEFLNLQLTKAAGEGHFINGTNYQNDSVENSADSRLFNHGLGNNGTPGDGNIIKLMNSGDDNIVKDEAEIKEKKKIEDTDGKEQVLSDVKENTSKKSLKKKTVSRSCSKKKRKGELLMAHNDHNVNISNQQNTHNTVSRRRSKQLKNPPVLPVSPNSINSNSNSSNITTNSSNSSNCSSINNNNNNVSDPSFTSKLVHNKQQEKLDKEDILIKTYSNTSLFILHQHAQNNNNQSLLSSSSRPNTATKLQYGTKIRQPYNMDKNNHSTSSKGFSIRSKSVKRFSSLKLQSNQLRKSTPRPSSPCLGNWREKIDKQSNNNNNNHDNLLLNHKNMNDKENMNKLQKEEDGQEDIIISKHSQNNNDNDLESIVHSTSSSSCNNSSISNPVSKTHLYNSTSFFNDKDTNNDNNNNDSNYYWNNMKDNSTPVKTPFPYQSQCQWYKEQVHISKLLGQRHNIHDPVTFLTSRNRYPSTNFEEPRLKRLKMIVKKGRPGKFSSKINLSRINHNNSKLSLPNYPTLRNSTTIEKNTNHESLGRNSSATSNTNNHSTSISNNFKTKRFQNKKFKNRLMFYVEDSPNEERYLMSYDLQTRTRSKLASYSFTGNGNCMIFHEGSLYDMGGCFKDQANNRLEIFDFDQNYGKKPKWRSRKVPKMILPRYGFQTTIHDNKIYVIGGLGLGAMNWAEKLDLQESNQKNWKWTNIQMLNRSRAFSGVTVFNDKIYALGGFSIDSDERACKVTATNSVEYYCSKTDEWEFAPGLQTERAGLCAAVLHNKLYVIGGGIQRVPDSKLKSVECFDPEIQEWKFCASMKKARQYFSVAVFDDHILAVGGDDDKCPTMERYDPIDNEWKIIDYIPVAGNYSSVGFKDIENDDLQNPFQIQIPPSPINH